MILGRSGLLAHLSHLSPRRPIPVPSGLVRTGTVQACDPAPFLSCTSSLKDTQLLLLRLELCGCFYFFISSCRASSDTSAQAGKQLHQVTCGWTVESQSEQDSLDLHACSVDIRIASLLCINSVDYWDADVIKPAVGTAELGNRATLCSEIFSFSSRIPFNPFWKEGLAACKRFKRVTFFFIFTFLHFLTSFLQPEERLRGRERRRGDLELIQRFRLS